MSITNYNPKTGLEAVQEVASPPNANPSTQQVLFRILFSRKLTERQQWWPEHFIHVVKLNIHKEIFVNFFFMQILWITSAWRYIERQACWRSGRKSLEDKSLVLTSVCDLTSSLLLVNFGGCIWELTSALINNLPRNTVQYQHSPVDRTFLL